MPHALNSWPRAPSRLTQFGQVRRGPVSFTGSCVALGLLARLSTPALTTIQQDTLEAGRRLVSQVMDAHSEQFLDYLPTHLIVRESCRA